MCSCGQHLIFQGRTLLRDGFDRETSRLIARMGHACRLGMYFESEEGFWLENSFPPLAPNLQVAVDRLRRNGEVVVSPLTDERFRCDKLSISYTPDSRLQEFLTFIRPYCEIIDQGRRMYELPKRGHSKGAGCRKLAQLLHTPLEDIISGCMEQFESANMENPKKLGLAAQFSEIAYGCSEKSRKLMLRVCRDIAQMDRE